MGCKEFDEALLDAVDFAFHSLGKFCQQTLYFHFKKTFHIERVEIPSKVEEFDNALKSIFKGGAVFLERLILRKLCEELGVKFEAGNVFDFVEVVSEVRSMALEKELLLIVSNFDEVTVVRRKSGGGKT